MIYDKIVEVIDRVKTDEEPQDTDSYAIEIVNAISIEIVNAITDALGKALREAGVIE